MNMKYSQQSYSNLVKDIGKGDVTLVCGAGVSASAKLPSWYNFLNTIVQTFLSHWNFKDGDTDSIPKNMSINHIYTEDSLWPWINEYKIDAQPFLKEDPLVLAQLIKNCMNDLNWKYLLKKALYHGVSTTCFQESALIKSIYEFIKNEKTRTTGLITYNFDDLFESYFKYRKDKCTSISFENSHVAPKTFPIYHVHGIISQNGGNDCNVTFAEEDYLKNIMEPFSWYNRLHCGKLSETTCVFIGISFNDPSIKRLLALNKTHNGHFHYAFLTHNGTEYQKKKFILLRHELLRLNVRTIMYEYTDDHSMLVEKIKALEKDIA